MLNLVFVATIAALTYWLAKHRDARILRELAGASEQIPDPKIDAALAEWSHAYGEDARARREEAVLNSTNAAPLPAPDFKHVPKRK
jgi:hypothetical protein